MTNTRKRQGGFTLIELITVIIILGILAAVVAPRYFNMAGEAREAAAKGALSEGVARFNMAYAKYILDNENTPANLNVLRNTTYLGGNGWIVIGDYRIRYRSQGAAPNLEVLIQIQKDDGTGTFDWIDDKDGNRMDETIPWPDGS